MLASNQIRVSLILEKTIAKQEKKSKRFAPQIEPTLNVY